MAHGDYNLPVYSKLNRTDANHYYSEHIQNETVYVHNSRGTLFGMPDRRYGVYITGMTEIDFNEEIIKDDQFKVDYDHTGTILFHDTFKQEKVHVLSYYSRGLQYFPAARIWTKIDSLGNVLMTLDDTIDLLLEVDTNTEEIEELIRITEKLIRDTADLFVRLAESVEESEKAGDALESNVREGKITNRELVTAIEDSRDIIALLEEAAEMFEEVQEVMKRMDSQIELGESIIVNIKSLNEIADNLLGQLSQMSESGNELLEALQESYDITESLLLELKQGIDTAQQTYTDLQSLYTQAQMESEKLQKLIEESTGLQESVEVTLGELKSENTDAKDNIEELLRLMSEVDTIVQGLGEAVADGDKLLEQLQEIAESGNLDWLLEVAHDHENKDVLDELSESDGFLQYKGRTVSRGITVTSKDVPEDLNTGDQWHQIVS